LAPLPLFLSLFLSPPFSFFSFSFLFPIFFSFLLPRALDPSSLSAPERRPAVLPLPRSTPVGLAPSLFSLSFPARPPSPDLAPRPRAPAVPRLPAACARPRPPRHGRLAAPARAAPRCPAPLAPAHDASRRRPKL